MQATTKPDARRTTFARRVLEHVELHVALQKRAIDEGFRQEGSYETALRDGSNYLEAATRTLGGFKNSDVGTKLCGKARMSPPRASRWSRPL